ncbi:MAG: hypothetical protein E6J54_30410 [Deltaproteobacteria bacterium]|nr:MAG: hypothetical protein E6J54_30410 [Deltaproteobacteria bacterium]
MFGTANYAQPLRAIGQALELLNVESFDMEPDGEDFLVRGKATLPGNSPEQPSEEDKVRHIWGVLPRQRTLESGMNVPARPVTVTQLELRYTPKDVDRLESEGRAKRMDPRRIPDAGSLSQLFRTIGAYIGQKRARLLKVSWNGNSIVLLYETSPGRLNDEVLTVSDLYDVSVRMYMKRADRNPG